MKPEAQLTKAIRGLLKTLGIYHWKQHQGLGSTPGVADILGVIPAHVSREKAGRMLAIEVKAPRGTLSAHQQRFIDRVNRDGGLAFVAWSVDDVIDNLGVRDRFLV